MRRCRMCLGVSFLAQRYGRAFYPPVTCCPNARAITKSTGAARGRSVAWSTAFAALICLTGAWSHAGAAQQVTTARVPHGGLQPQAAVDAQGVVHLVYLKGDPATADVFYVRSADAGATWSDATRVNSEPGSAVAMGTVRGAHLAVGPDGRPHVAWMGSRQAKPRGPGDATPMLYARLADGGEAFEPQRNVIAQKVGLDGGGSVAVDAAGRVHVAWHAPADAGGKEEDRAVWLATSADGGRSFAPETCLSAERLGVCACCGMRLFADGDRLLALYRTADQTVNRDIHLLVRPAEGGPAAEQELAPVKVGMCIMSTAAIARSPAGPVVLWESNKQIQWAAVDPKTGKVDPAAVRTIPGDGQGGRKHPAAAVNRDGQVLVVWAEGTGWQKGGAVAWQLFDAATGRPTAGATGRQGGLPAWSLPAVIAKPDGSFLVLK